MNGAQMRYFKPNDASRVRLFHSKNQYLGKKNGSGAPLFMTMAGIGGFAYFYSNLKNREEMAMA